MRLLDPGNYWYDWIVASFSVAVMILSVWYLCEEVSQVSKLTASLLFVVDDVI